MRRLTGPRQDEVVQLAPDVPVALPLPSSRVDLIRIALLAGTAAQQDPDNPRSPILRALHARLASIIGNDSLFVAAGEPAIAGPIRAAIRQSRNLAFTYRSLSDTTPSRRTVVPLEIRRHGKWWLLETQPMPTVHHNSASVTYRLDRILGPVEDAGPSTAARTPVSTGMTRRTPIRLRLHANDLWTTDDLDPTDLESVGDDQFEVTINLYPPVGERLSRVLFLADPRTTVVVDAVAELETHRLRIRERSPLD